MTGLGNEKVTISFLLKTFVLDGDKPDGCSDILRHMFGWQYHCE